MESNGDNVKEYIKWRERAARSLPSISIRVFALRKQSYSGCGFHYLLERQLGIAISSVQNVNREAFECMQMILTKLVVTQLYKDVISIEREIKMRNMNKNKANTVSSFFYYMWNTWCEEECRKVFGSMYEHFWSKWCSMANPSAHGSSEKFYSALSERNRTLLVNRACEVYNGAELKNLQNTNQKTTE